ncbi:MAG: hypothetical protein FD165_2551 [Gammaproteobacteria bacterium]|nr:MAG: hypothetical protein FD165_2551 [Gammaproteobacteria bacterium]TND02971.1 MAG: hypothetical protein FD120_2040 [Gammaproteobacteria bacterium]
MRTGEKRIIAVIIALPLLAIGYQLLTFPQREADPGIPFYLTASPEIKQQAELIYARNKCSDCHSLWMVRNMMESVPAPRLDGIGSLRDERWFFEYFSASDPQQILPSRLKQEYRMPSYAHLPVEERRTLAAYMAGLKVEDWYLEDVRKAEYEKLTGKPYRTDQPE